MRSIPEDHDRTLRDRLASATEVSYCWKCHERMNPLGYPFEMYDDFGRFRTEESLEYPEHLVEKKPDKAPGRNHLLDLRDIYKTLPVDATGYLEGTGDPALDGEVTDAPSTSSHDWANLGGCGSRSSATPSATSWGATRSSPTPGH